MNFSQIIKRIFCDVAVISLCILIITPFTSFHGDLAEAEGFDIANEGIVAEDSALSYPYTKTFTISAYYSPLPCQNKYTTGSYEGDIRLNGSGVNSADGTPVYPGMIAAPRSYSFGTKMYIPGVGIVAVHDRGGAIVASNGAYGLYDRLDIWMGYGDKGLKRALNWGKRTLDVTVYGMNAGIIEQISLEGYSPGEAVAGDCSYQRPEVVVEPVVEELADPTNKLESDLEYGDESNEVLFLQGELKELNFLKGELNGVYDELTEHAVFKFQQSQLLVGDRDSLGAGIFGSKTRDRLNEIILSRNYTKVLVAQATTEDENKRSLALAVERSILESQLSSGAVGHEVRVLQQFLKDQGFFKGMLITDYFGPITQEAVMAFQLANNIISSSGDLGAGRVGPTTLEAINSFS